ncbi:M48 family metalloprotease [Amycolatopsis sp. lyj-23]|uniref:M48 family metalloprotease n=1 Tax=Amycolatopsis sp. lyj-23 TaxID=2789283 RepID=UPI003978E267
MIFYVVFGQWFGDTLNACGAAAQRLPLLDQLDLWHWFEQCEAPAERVRTGFACIFGLVAFIAGWGLRRRWLPQRLYRRVGRTRVAAARWQDEAAAAVRSMGGRVAPEVVFGSTCREAFTVRIDGRILVVLPYGVLTLPKDEASALLRHECAHVAAGDVDRVWLTQAVWWATPVVMVLPFLAEVGRVVIAQGKTFADLVFTAYNLEYTIRSAALLALVWLVARSVLRAREHQADLLSSQDSSDALKALLGRGQQTPRTLLTAFRAIHPPLQQRLDVLERRGVERHTRVAEGFAFGALIGIVQPVLWFFVESLIIPLADLSVSTLAAALVPGVLLGGAWGMTAWYAHTADDARSALARTVSALGLPLGVVLGLALSLTGDGSSLFETKTLLQWGFAAVALIGAASTYGGIAALWHRYRPDTSPWWAVLVAVLLFTGAIELVIAFNVAIEFDPVVASGGSVGMWLFMTAVPRWGLLVGQCVVAVVVWRTVKGARRRLLLLTVIVSVLIAVPRLLFFVPLTEETKSDYLMFNGVLAAAAGLAVFLVCVAIDGRAGIATGVACAWPAALLTVLALTLKFDHPMAAIWFSVMNAAEILTSSLLMISAVAAVVSVRSSDRRLTLLACLGRVDGRSLMGQEPSRSERPRSGGFRRRDP